MMRALVVVPRPSLLWASWIATTLTPLPAFGCFHPHPSATTKNNVLPWPIMQRGPQQCAVLRSSTSSTSAPPTRASSLDDVLERTTDDRPGTNDNSGLLLLLDGGTGEELMRQGLPDDRKTWSAKALTDPEYHHLLLQVHKSFLRAGAQVITTNSYGVTPGVGFSNDEIAHYGNLAGQLARQACHEYMEEEEAAAATEPNGGLSEEESKCPSSTSMPCFVLGSLGPLRESYRPDLIVPDHEQGVQLYGTMVRALDPHVDAFVAETVSCVPEAKQAVEAVQRLATHSPNEKSCWVSFTLNSQGQLRDGTPVHQAVPALLDFARSIGAKVPVVLFNCCEPEAIDLALAELQSHHLLPDPKSPKRAEAVVDATIGTIRWGAYANRLTVVAPDWTMASSETAQPLRTDVTPKEYAQSFAHRWVHNYGLSVVGGCCGITPEHIAALKATLQAN